MNHHTYVTGLHNFELDAEMNVLNIGDNAPFTPPPSPVVLQPPKLVRQQGMRLIDKRHRRARLMAATERNNVSATTLIGLLEEKVRLDLEVKRLTAEHHELKIQMEASRGFGEMASSLEQPVTTE